MKTWLIKWLLRRLGYPVDKLAGGPSLQAVLVDGVVVYATSLSPHRARALARQEQALVAKPRVKLFLYRAYQELEV